MGDVSSLLSWEAPHPDVHKRRRIKTRMGDVSSPLLREMSHPDSHRKRLIRTLMRDVSCPHPRETPHADSHRRRLTSRLLQEASQPDSHGSHPDTHGRRLIPTLTGGASSRLSQEASKTLMQDFSCQHPRETPHPDSHRRRYLI